MISIKTLKVILIVWTVLGVLSLLADLISGYGEVFINLAGLLFSGLVLYYFYNEPKG